MPPNNISKTRSYHGRTPPFRFVAVMGQGQKFYGGREIKGGSWERRLNPSAVWGSGGFSHNCFFYNTTLKFLDFDAV